MDIMRGIVLRGVGIFELWLDIVALAFMGVFFLIISALRFNKSDV
jgi:hypothetical protein